MAQKPIALPVTDAQALALWERLLATGQKPSIETVFGVVKIHKCLQVKAGELILTLDPNKEDLERLLALAWYDVHGSHVTQEVADALLKMELDQNSLGRLVSDHDIRHESRLEAWRRYLECGNPQPKRLLAIVEWGGMPFREEAGRLLLQPELAAVVSKRKPNLGTLNKLLEYVPELHEEVWPIAEKAYGDSSLFSMWRHIQMVAEIHAQIADELKDESERPYREMMRDRFADLARKMAEQVFSRAPNRRRLLSLVERADPAVALKAAHLLLENPSSNVELRRILRHVPELRDTAWRQLLLQKPTNADLKEIIRYVPELKKEAQALLSPETKQELRMSEAENPPEGTAPLSEADQILQELTRR